MNIKIHDLKINLKTILILLGIVLSYNGYAQKDLPFSFWSKQDSEYPTNIEFTIGFIPKTSYQGPKCNLTINNLVLERFGIYYSAEYFMNSSAFRNIIGGTTSVSKRIYLFGGMDLFTKHGYFNQDFKSSRKEIGIGIIPYKNSVIRVGYSFSVGFSFSVGLQFQNF